MISFIIFVEHLDIDLGYQQVYLFVRVLRKFNLAFLSFSCLKIYLFALN